MPSPNLSAELQTFISKSLWAYPVFGNSTENSASKADLILHLLPHTPSNSTTVNIAHI